MGVSLDREPIAAALAARLQANCPLLKKVTRLWVPDAQVDPSQKPYAIVTVGNQVATVRRGAPTLWKLALPVYVYTHADPLDTTTARSTAANAIVKQIEDALERLPTDTVPPTDMGELYSTNLGLRNVFNCRLTLVDIDEAFLGSEGVIGLLVEVEAAPS